MATYDKVRAELERQISIYRYRDFETSLMADVSINKHPKARTYEIRTRCIGQSRYLVQAWGHPQAELTTSKRSFVSQDLKKAVSHLHTYLDTLTRHVNPMDNEDLSPEVRIKQSIAEQQLWWKHNLKSFRLFDLPPELRVHIYAAILPTSLWPYCAKKEQTCYRHWYDKQGFELTKTNSQLRREVIHHSMKYTKYIIDRVSSFDMLTSHSIFMRDAKHLELALDGFEYLQFFRIVPSWSSRRGPISTSVTCSDESARSHPLKRLRSMQLMSLTIRISDAQRCIRDWFCAHIINDWQSSHSLDIRICHEKLEAFFTSCILSCVRGIRSVILVGRLSETTKTKFENDIRKAWLEYESWKDNAISSGHEDISLNGWDVDIDDEDGGVRLDERENKRAEDIDP